jgi:RNA polymerase sigma-70 factor (ECF subfamily)
MRVPLRTRPFHLPQPVIGGDDDLTAADDRTLVARARVDRAVFAELYRRYVDGVYWYCLGRLRDAAMAEDATSQVFAQALAALPRYRDHERETAFRAWLFRIAHNVIVDAVRARHGHESLATVADLMDHRNLPEEVVIRDEAQRAIWDLVATLPPDQRSIIELRLVGLTGMEIATVLGRSRGAVDTAQSRAVARLRVLVQSSALPGWAETADDGSR